MGFLSERPFDIDKIQRDTSHTPPFLIKTMLEILLGTFNFRVEFLSFFIF